MFCELVPSRNAFSDSFLESFDMDPDVQNCACAFARVCVGNGAVGVSVFA